MTKFLTILTGCALLAGCVAHETDFQAAQEHRDMMLAEKRAQHGCSFIRDHDAYRECLLNTYYSQHPQTYTPSVLSDGEPVAIVSTRRRGGSGCHNQSMGMPSEGPQIVPYVASESTTVETTCTHDYQNQEAVITTEEEIPVVPMVQNVQTPVVTPKPVVTTPVKIPSEPVAEESWWESYQDTKMEEPVTVVPKCPCDDPNDPCPQCYDK